MKNVGSTKSLAGELTTILAELREKQFNEDILMVDDPSPIPAPAPNAIAANGPAERRHGNSCSICAGFASECAEHVKWFAERAFRAAVPRPRGTCR